VHRWPGWWPLDDRGSGVLALRRRGVFASCWVFSVILGWKGLWSLLAPSFFSFLSFFLTSRMGNGQSASFFVPLLLLGPDELLRWLLPESPFVQMGGGTSAPWGGGWLQAQGKPGSTWKGCMRRL
jgi:hypothetical protein